MGSFGNAFFNINFTLFGILSYFYPPCFLYLGYILYKTKKLTWRYAELCLAWTLFFLLLLVLQTSIFGLGIFGQAIIEYLKPYLGLFGIWVLSLLGIGMCLISISNADIFQILQMINFSHRFAQLILSLKSITSKLTCHLARFSKSFFASLQRQITTIKTKIYTKEKSPLEELPRHIDLKDLLPEQSTAAHQTQHTLPFIPEIPKTTQAKKEKFVFKKDDKINIQEYIVATRNEEKRSHIRVVDEIKPIKENPFLKDNFPIHSQGISTSAELLKRIKNQDLHPSLAQHNIKSTPSQQETSTPPSHLAQTTQPPQETTISQSLKPLESPESLDLTSTEPIHPSPLKAELPPFETPQELNIPQILMTETLSHPSSTYPSTPPHLSKSKITHIKTLEENEALLKEIDQGDIFVPKDYKLPPISLLSEAPRQNNEIDENEIDSKIQSLLEKLSVFKIEGDVIRTYSGPIITTLEFRPAPNVKVSRIQSLENDIAMALEAKSIRIQAPIPGKNVVGIEIPNSSTQTIYLREIFESEIFQNSSSPLTLALGKDVVGNPFITDLKKLPHLLIAGTTGSGKSVGVNAMILSLLYRNSPDDLKLMMVDPKMVEFMPYSDLPHLITPIITDPKKAVIGLANAVREMERRYTLMSQSRTKEIISYNQKAEELGLEKFPYFVIIIDELADLIVTAGKEVEYSLGRISAMGRASGMHLIVATQSPRADILIGQIKTNLPAHLSFKVGSKIDAGIIGCAGAETLLGRGDMLFTPPGVSGLVRLHAPWSSEDEVNEIVSYIKDQRGTMYDVSFLPEDKESFGAMDCQDLDPETAQLLEKAKQIIIQDGKTSISYLQRRLSIGYNKAATLIETLEQIGFLSEPDAKGNRQIL
ncbi:FtsK/SpoIIIE family DNA translocase [Helicobacter pametensis]|uniref:FtsK/SpoIIIE family DNA translocase n=1 Tax=Helicobacter pametensis TaxID=95149 RepID=UPI000A01DC26|nr:DNA translocase FtsK [Helicobacter pametensis]